MTIYTDIDVYYDEVEGVSCDPASADLFYDDPGGPDRARWTAKTYPENAVTLEIDFGLTSNSPFDEGKFSGSISSALCSPANSQNDGEFKYTARYLDDEGSTLADVDPVIMNQPKPPPP